MLGHTYPLHQNHMYTALPLCLFKTVLSILERLSLGYFQVGSNKIFHCFLRVTVDFFHQCQSCGLRHSAPCVTQSSFTYMERIITLNINVPLNHLRNLVKIQIFMTKSLRSGSRFCISNNFPDNAKAASLIIKFCGIRS